MSSERRTGVRSERRECVCCALPNATSRAQTVNERRANVVQQAQVVISCIIGSNKQHSHSAKVIAQVRAIPFDDCDTGDSASREIFTPLSRAFAERYGIDPLTPVYSTEDDAMFGKLRMPILSAVLGFLDEDPAFDVDGYVGPWKAYFEQGAHLA